MTPIVGVNRFEDDAPPPLIPAPDYSALEQDQVVALAALKACRDNAPVMRALAAVENAGRDLVTGEQRESPIMASIIDAVRARCTVGEIASALEKHWGLYTPATNKLRAGDIITAFNGRDVKNVQELRNEVAATPPNTDVKVQVFREGKDQPITMRLGEQPEDLRLASANGKSGGPAGAMPDADAGKLGLRLASPSDELAKQYDLADVKEGAVVTAVERNSPAAKANLFVGDVITKVGNKTVRNAVSAV